MTRECQLAKEVALFLAQNTGSVLDQLPWPLSRLCDHLVKHACVASDSDAELAVRYLGRTLPFSVVIEDEGRSSCYLVYYSPEHLSQWVLHAPGPRAWSPLSGVFDDAFSPPDNVGALQDMTHSLDTLQVTSSEPLSPLSSSSESSISSLQLSAGSFGLGVTSPKRVLSALLAELARSPTQLVQLAGEIEAQLNARTCMEEQQVSAAVDETAKGPFVDICMNGPRDICISGGDTDCLYKVHFDRVMTSATDVSLGDCSYLDTCFKGKGCKYVHYRLHTPAKRTLLSIGPTSPRQNETDPYTLPPQYIKCNFKDVDFSTMGNDYAALIVDPPWDIHTNGNVSQTGIMNDGDIACLDIGHLQKEGIILLWVTGRALDAGRQCLRLWGYDKIEELVWCKTNQLGRTICTGRTGHWINHTKEHVLVGIKQNPGWLVRQLDVDVIVSSTRGKSQKPEELYNMIDRVVGKQRRKLELFGRKNNLRPGWLTMGIELDGTLLTDPDLVKRWTASSRKAHRPDVLSGASKKHIAN